MSEHVLRTGRRVDNLHLHPVEDSLSQLVRTRLEQGDTVPHDPEPVVSPSSDTNRFTGPYGSSAAASVTTAVAAISMVNPLAPIGSHSQRARNRCSVSIRSIRSCMPAATNAPSRVVSNWLPCLQTQCRSSNSRSVRPIVDDDAPVTSKRSARLWGRLVMAESAAMRCSDRARNSISSRGELLIIVNMRSKGLRGV